MQMDPYQSLCFSIPEKPQESDSTPRILTLGNNDEKGNNRKQSSHSLCIQSFFPSFFFLWETLPVVHVHL